MHWAIICISICVIQANLAFGQGGFGVGTHLARVISYAIKIETRIGYLDCELTRSDEAAAEVVECAYPDGTTVPIEELVRLGLVETLTDE